MKILSYSDNVDYFVGLYKRKIFVLKSFVTITNIVFPTIALLLIVISTFNIAGGEYETPIKGADYIIFSALISGIIALINSLISFFLLKEKINYYNETHYKLIIEKQRYKLDSDKYLSLDNEQEKKRVFENELFIIITGYIKEDRENE
ncbi:MAG: DUF4231 domain-containing protein [Mycoplasmataceae bacterium]|nr:DUF4231 domain-containing protein [Mycoplasmataceae bacterium]